METKAKDLSLWKNDPLLYFPKEKLGFSGLLIALLLTLTAAIVLFGLGWIASSTYTGGGVRFTDPEYYYFALAAVFLFAPISFGVYVWQPEAFARVLESFEQTDVIEEVSREGKGHVKSYPDFLARFRVAVGRKAWATLAVILAIGFLANQLLIVGPSEFGTTGRSVFWYDVKWFTAILSLLFLVWAYAFWMILLKQAGAILYFNRLFQWFDIRIRPMHADEAGGLGALGNFTLRLSAALVAAGAGIALYSIIVWMRGLNPFARPDILLFWVLYVLTVPASLLLPMLSAHNAMQEARNEKLNEIAREFEQTLAEASVTKADSAQAIKEANERLKELQTRYKIVADSLPTWPLPVRLVRNFSITASLPLVTGLASFAIDFATK